jgi:hypothetical protein
MPFDIQNQLLTPEQFPILPWGWTPASLEVLEGIRECGFNLAGFVNPQDLDQVQRADLKAIVYDHATHVIDEAAEYDDKEIAQRVQALVSRVKGHPALFGYYLRDEPSAKAYPGLARWSQAFRQADPNALPYINLFPNYAQPSQMGVPDYEQYVQEFLEQVSPPFLSYDNYSLMQDGSLRNKYFPNLEAMRAAALRSGLPFWNIVLSNAHFEYAEPTLAGLRFQVYSTLAYGARGISYFTYFAPDVGNYRLAPINQVGEKTPTWDMLREVNMQIHRLGPIYLRLKSVNVFHTQENPVGSLTFESSHFLESISGGSFVVGEFETPDGQPHIIVVNKDMRQSVPVKVCFKQQGQILRTSPYSGKSALVGGEDSWLAPGQGVLLAIAP